MIRVREKNDLSAEMEIRKGWDTMTDESSLSISSLSLSTSLKWKRKEKKTKMMKTMEQKIGGMVRDDETEFILEELKL